MLVRIESRRPAQMIYHFDNGVSLSMIWGAGSYTENHMKRDFESSEFVSETVEIYSNGAQHYIDTWLNQEYGGNPASVPVRDIPKILEIADDGGSQNE